MSQEHEVWKPIPGFPHYEASSMGRVRSIDRRLPFNGTTRIYYGRDILPRPLPNGYQRIAAGRKCDTYIHRLVCLAFHGEPPLPRMDVNHKNGIKSDNRAENLEWMTRSQNKKHAHDILGINPWNWTGKHHRTWSEYLSDVKDRRALLLDMYTRFKRNGWTMADLGNFWGKKRSAISMILIAARKDRQNVS